MARLFDVSHVLVPLLERRAGDVTQSELDHLSAHLATHDQLTIDELEHVLLMHRLDTTYDDPGRHRETERELDSQYRRLEITATQPFDVPAALGPLLERRAGDVTQDELDYLAQELATGAQVTTDDLECELLSRRMRAARSDPERNEQLERELYALYEKISAARGERRVLRDPP